ncbi:methenyltetrahydrofolate cyclohydrolase (plasmid) [Legionella adelaidensis]|uniref:Bifunctional protein FolD n=1 Tax=Legionella adelaidensis TaxID=45056 RepID=A0A0W0R279_9GAMM|nr:bifunctional methylenetetrahydrofolate dehydrogenase/methenyltetrahydrofolate cyclohydrolase FolD [Legionella adelaidensis]KTC65157.1 methenyltetrahydrofolate cyclohydrolase/5,10-methylenetetrahydrofolate dehydrogenase (NADP+) [Legionella adelaidensis]VEH85049.1 methenyltetrahydrofolate cyclohydrolase [Legionella adelaidensis]
MTCSLLEGKKVSALMRAELKNRIEAYKEKGYRLPALAVLLIGSNPASKIYVDNKRRACEEIGITSHAYDLPENIKESELITLIEQLNQSENIDGILIQLPLPSQINTQKILECVSPLKDVDGFHPFNMGKLAQGEPFLRPCTPYGIIQLLQHYNIQLAGKNVVVIGASIIVGRPMALEFLNAKATVTICHRRTRNLEEHVKKAEIIVVATGVINVVPAEWLQSHQIVIDVGIHRLAEGKLRGDIDFALAKNKVSWLTPVPGGVGPMTIATLLQNTFKAYAHNME